MALADVADLTSRETGMAMPVTRQATLVPATRHCHQRVTAPSTSRDERFTAALRAVSSLRAENPLDADAQFVHGLVALEAGEPAAAALRRALYAHSRFAIAAFAFGRACEALADYAAERRAYEQALRTLDTDDDRPDVQLQQNPHGAHSYGCRGRLGGEA